MRVAFLILAHNTPNHLRRLVAALRHPDHHVFVHVDAKQDIAPFAGVAADDVSLIDRIEVEWGDISGVRAALRLLSAARAAGPFDYYVLLSASDYPLYSAGDVNAFFRSHDGLQFISSTAMPAPEAGKPISRYETFYPRKGKGRTMWERLRARYYRGRVRDYRRALGGLAPHGGSAWFAVTDRAVATILAFERDHRRAARFIANTLIPEESYFQTVLSNSPLAPDIAACVTYADWRKGGPSPVNIGEEHVAMFADHLFAARRPGRCLQLFARKFHDDAQDLTDRIDRFMQTRPLPPRDATGYPAPGKPGF